MESRHREALAVVLEAAEQWYDILCDDEAFTEPLGEPTILHGAMCVVRKDLLDEQ